MEEGIFASVEGISLTFVRKDTCICGLFFDSEHKQSLNTTEILTYSSHSPCYLLPSAAAVSVSPQLCRKIRHHCVSQSKTEEAQVID